MSDIARPVTTSALAVALALGGLVVPVVSLPTPQASAVAPELDRVPLTGVDKQARQDRTALAAAVGHGHAGGGARGEAGHDEHEDGVLAALSPRTETLEFLVAGVTWDRASDEEVTEVALRVRERGTWRAWQSVGVEPDGFDGGRAGTEPFVTTGADAVQARVRTASGDLPEDLRVDVIDPGSTAADATVGATAAPAASAQAATGYEIKPRTVSRRGWGADESLASPWPELSGDLQALYVHHTAGTNSYSRSQSPGIVRGIYAYHTASRGWPDIGYQFLVDRFGTTYEGRRTAVHDNPVGAHAGAFNTGTVGVSAMGNFEEVRPPQALLTALVNALSWKAYQYGVNAAGTTVLTDRGSPGDTAPTEPGDKVRVPTIVHHGYTNSTACPGRYLRVRMPDIRRAVSYRVGQARQRYGVPTPALPAPSANRPAPGTAPVQWRQVGTVSWDPVAGADRYHVLARRADLDGDLPTWPYWYLVKSVRATSADLYLEPGRSAVYAVRAVGGNERRGAIQYVTTTTREVLPDQWAISSRWRKIQAEGYHHGMAYRTDTDGARIVVRGAHQVKGIRLRVATAETHGRIKVSIGGTTVRWIDLSEWGHDRQKDFVMNLRSSHTGEAVVVETVGTDEVRVSGIGLVRG